MGGVPEISAHHRQYRPCRKATVHTQPQSPRSISIVESPSGQVRSSQQCHASVPFPQASLVHGPYFRDSSATKSCQRQCPQALRENWVNSESRNWHRLLEVEELLYVKNAQLQEI
jgi:hypothetical protein